MQYSRKYDKKNFFAKVFFIQSKKSGDKNKLFVFV